MIYHAGEGEILCGGQYLPGLHINGSCILKECKCWCEYWYCKHMVGHCFNEYREHRGSYVLFSTEIFFSDTCLVTGVIVRYVSSIPGYL